MRYAIFDQTINGVTRQIRFNLDALELSHITADIDGKTSRIVMTNGACFTVDGTPDDAWSKWQTEPIKLAWSQPSEDVALKAALQANEEKATRVCRLEAERDAARRTAAIAREHAGKLEAQVKVWLDVANKYASRDKGPRLITNPSELGDFLERNQETEQHLESQLKAWKDAASIELVEDSGEPATTYNTPDSLASRLQDLYRWASTTEKRAKTAEQIAINERESHKRTRKNADEWCHRACVAENEAKRLKSKAKAEEPLEPNRVIKTAHSLITEAARNPRTFHQKGYLFSLAKDAIEALYGGSTPKLEPYRTEGQL